jgi:hypothetical protein
VHNRNSGLSSLREIESLWDSVRRNSAKRTLSGCAGRAQERTLLSFGAKKSLGEDLHRVFEHHADSARSCLRKRLPRGHQILHLREKEKG